MKGIILSGGCGTRLFPMTEVYQKQLLPIYDKPMIYYAISLLMLIKVSELAIITTSKALEPLKKLLKDGNTTGLKITFIVQEENECKGIGKAILLCEDYIGSDNFCLVLGDTLLFGAELTNYLLDAKNTLNKENGAVVLESYVSNPEQFGAIQYDSNNLPIGIIEKGQNVNNMKAIPGIYFFTPEAMEFAKHISRSKRNEYEITEVLLQYLKNNKLYIKQCGRGFIWIDTGTPQAIAEAASFISITQNTLGVVLSCIEEIAFNNGWISLETLKNAAEQYKTTEYGLYISKLINNHIGNC